MSDRPAADAWALTLRTARARLVRLEAGFDKIPRTNKAAREIAQWYLDDVRLLLDGIEGGR